MKIETNKKSNRHTWKVDTITLNTNPKGIDTSILSVSFGKSRIFLERNDSMTKKDRMELETLRNGRKNQLRGIISQLSSETDNESILRAIAITLATTQDKALKDERDVYSIIEKGGVAL